MKTRACGHGDPQSASDAGRPALRGTNRQQTGRDRRRVRRWVLVADDDRTIRLLLTRVLREEGYAVVAARDGVEALELANQVQPHLMILDLRMPRMSGVQLLVRARRIPTIVLSGFLADLPEDVASNPNIVARLEKPVALDVLRAAVRRALGA